MATDAQQQLLNTLANLGIPSFHDPSFCISAATLESVAAAPPGDFNAHQHLCTVDGGKAFTVDGHTLVNGPLAVSYLAYGANGSGIIELRWAILAVTAEALAPLALAD
jgi:hypothetical protein